MSGDEWEKFDWSLLLRPDGKVNAGATEEEIAYGAAATFFHKMTKPELKEVWENSRNPWLPNTPKYDAWTPTDASGWVFPRGPFSASYLSLMRWTNGGSFRVGRDRILRLWSIDGLRGWMRQLLAPKNLPLGVPFAFNDFYHIYFFDMRQPLVDEYPIMITPGNVMHYAYAAPVAATLVEFLSLPDDPKPPSRPLFPV